MASHGYEGVLGYFGSSRCRASSSTLHDSDAKISRICSRLRTTITRPSRPHSREKTVDTDYGPADDFVILCRSPEDAARALSVVQTWTAEAGLKLHPDKTKIVDATTSSFDFLGYRFERGQRTPRPKSMQKLKDTVRAKTKRTSGESLKTIIDHLNPTLRGWFGYFKHSHRTAFAYLDGWIRMRLRSILRNRLGLKGRGRGIDHTRWPNAFFAEQGLYSLKTAHALACQSSRR
jgi:RNA-directed DNA polymerase